MSRCGEPCDGCSNRAEHHLCDACCDDEVDAIRKENRELSEEIERLRLEREHTGRALEDAIVLQHAACAEAYRRGAEAMREVAAQGLDRLLTQKKATAIWVGPDEIRALPIPEDK